MASKSGKSSASGSKSAASSASTAGRARAKAEAAKIRAAYAAEKLKLKLESANKDLEVRAREAEKNRREAEIQFEKIRIDAELEVLELQCEAEATAAEAQVLEMAEATTVIGEAEASEAETKIERTSDYVRSQNALKESANSPDLPVADSSYREPEHFVTPPHSLHMEPDESFQMRQSPAADFLQPSLGDAKTELKAENDVYSPLPAKNQVKSEHQRPTYNPDENRNTNLSQHTNKIVQSYTPEPMNVHASPYVPKQPSTVMPTPVAEPLAQYLIRRDLTTSGLYQFDDKPEN